MANSTTLAPGGARPFGAFEWMVARRYLGATKSGSGISLISLIALGGIALAVTALIVVMSVFQGFRITVLDQLLSVNGHVFVSQPGQPFTDYQARVDRISAVKGVERATPVLQLQAWAVGEGGQTAVILQGVAPDDIRAIPDIAGPDHLIAGSFDTFGQGRNGGREIALAGGVANALGVWEGDVVTLVTAGGAETAFGRAPTTQKDYRVGAVFRIGNTQLDQYYAYMPLEQAQIYGRRKGEVSEIEVRVAEPLQIDEYLGDLTAAAGFGASVFDWRDRNRSFFNALQVERAAMRIIMFFLVAVSTLLIVSGLVMLVKDKRSDIAVMRTMGVPTAGVTRIFLLIGVLIGISGTIIGVVVGTLIATNLDPIEGFLSWVFRTDLFPAEIYLLDGIPSVFEWHEVGIVASFTLLCSFLAAVIPAMSAAKIDPVEALRYE